MNDFEEREEIFHQTVGQLRTEKTLQNFIVIGIAQSYLIEIVGIHEFIKDIGTKHYSLGDGNRCILEFLELGMFLDDIIDECQTTAFSSQGPVAYSRKIGIAVETVTLEDGDYSLILHDAVFDDGIEDNLTVRIDILQGMPRNLLQKIGNREHGTRTKPT